MSESFPVRRRPGSRGRIGIIQPAPGVMLEHEWPAYLPPDLLFPVARVRLTAATAAGYDRIAADAPEAAADLATAGADLIAYACTIGSLYAGVAAERALVDRLAARAGRPAISLAETCVLALRRLGVHRPAIMTPYAAETNRWVADYARAQGLDVAGIVATPVDIVTVGNIQPAEIAALCIAALRDLPEADGLWLPCTAMQTIAAIPVIEAATGLPVASGSQALLWRALDLLGIADPIAGAGRLFGAR